jgi:hypothetical protein
MLTQEQIERIPSYARYWEDSDREAQAQARYRLLSLALTPSHMLPYFSITDYEKAQRGQSVPIEQPKPIPISSRQITDNRSLGQYIRDGEPISFPSPPAPRLSEVSLVSEYMARVDDTVPMYLRAVGDP